MCRMAWLGSDHELPVRECPADAKGLVMTITPDTSTWAKSCLKSKHVYALGHNGGCACHFGQGGVLAWDGDPRVLSADEERARSELADFLRIAVRKGNVDLLMTWEGEFKPKATESAICSPDAVTEQSFEFAESPKLVRFNRSA